MPAGCVRSKTIPASIPAGADRRGLIERGGLRPAGARYRSGVAEPGPTLVGLHDNVFHVPPSETRAPRRGTRDHLYATVTTRVSWRIVVRRAKRQISRFSPGTQGLWCAEPVSEFIARQKFSQRRIFHGGQVKSPKTIIKVTFRRRNLTLLLYTVSIKNIVCYGKIISRGNKTSLQGGTIVHGRSASLSPHKNY